MRKIDYWPVVLAATLVCSTVPAAANPVPEAGRVLGIEHYGWNPSTVLSAGDYVYVLRYKSLRVYNASSRNRPYLVTEVPVTSSSLMILDGNRLILSTGIVDISDPAAPVQTVIWDGIMLGESSAVQGDYLLRSVTWPPGTDHIDVLDLSDPANPTPAATINVYSTPYFQLSENGILVVLTHEGINFWDASVPTLCVYLGHCPLDRIVDLRYATIAGDYLYLLADGLLIVDMHDTANPFLAGSLDLDRWADRAPVIDETRLYAGYRHSLDIFDIQDPAHPLLLNNVPMLIADDDDGVRTAALQGTLCVVRSHQVSFLDCADAARPVVQVRDPLWSRADLEGVVHGNAVFDLRDGWVMIADTKLPGTPTWIYRLGGYNSNAEIVGPYLSLAGWKRELFDITNAAAPVSLGFDMDLPWWEVVNTPIGAIHLDESHVIKGWDTEGSSFPVQSWSLPVPFTPSDLAVLDDLFYVYAGGGLLSYRIVDGVPTTEQGLFIHEFDDFAVRSWWDTVDVIYLARGTDGLELWRCDDGVVSDTEPYAVLDDLDARTVQCSGAGLYVQNGAGGLRVYDVSDPGTPILAADFDLTGPTAADSVLVQPLVSDYDLIVGGGGTSRARIFKNLFAGVVPNEPGAPDGDPVPTALMLGAAYPNPFNPSTTLSFDLPTPERVLLTVHDARGRLVNTVFAGVKPVGRHTFPWLGRDDDGRTLPSGVYLATLQTADQTRSVKLTLAR